MTHEERAVVGDGLTDGEPSQHEQLEVVAVVGLGRRRPHGDGVAGTEHGQLMGLDRALLGTGVAPPAQDVDQGVE